jgi:putative addiction module component (TIGR02574 family)
MAALLEELEKKAQELPADERERLASHLLLSIHGSPLSSLENEWLDLAEQRFEALASGRDKGLSESEFFGSFGLRS